MLRQSAVLLALIALVGCGAKTSSAKPDSAADAENAPEGGAAPAAEQLSAGSSVCLNVLIGVRYPVEDALKEHGFEPAADCMFADAKLEEGGEPGAYHMRFQPVGGDQWQTCKSTAQKRDEFLAECLAQLAGDS